jgi:hypothetical protein
MRRTSKILSAIAGLILLAGIVFFIPYPVAGIPEWSLRIVDINGREVTGARVQQEWMDPIDRNIVHADSRTADASGKVVFPERHLHNRLVLGTSQSAPVSKVVVCWAGRFGSVAWDGKSTPPSQVQLDLNGCGPRYNF